MKRVRGFTLIELVIVIVVGGILTSIAMNSFGGVQSRMAVQSARNTFASYHARARAQAIERGVQVVVRVDVAGDSLWLTMDGDRIDGFDFVGQMNVDVQSSASNPIKVCLTPRGFADSDCNSFSSTITVTFAQAGHSSELEIWPLGQVKY